MPPPLLGAASKRGRAARARASSVWTSWANRWRIAKRSGSTARASSTASTSTAWLCSGRRRQPRCESLCLDCSSYNGPGLATGGGGGGCGGCANLDDQTNAVNDECYDEPAEDCSSGRPVTCNLECAHLLLPFSDDCAMALGVADASQFDFVVALCHAAEAAAADPCSSAPCLNGGVCSALEVGNDRRILQGEGSACTKFSAQVATAARAARARRT